MSRTADQIAQELAQLLPPSDFVWRSDADAYRAVPERAMAQEMALIEAQAEAMQLEIDPRTAAFTLDAFQRVLGPDPCGRDELGLSTQDEANIVFQRWTAGADVCAGMFVRLAASLGSTITIDEFWLSECGLMECGETDLASPPEQFKWRVNLTTERLIEFELGAAEIGATPLGDFQPSLLECVIRDLAPAHTLPVFSYTTGI